MTEQKLTELLRHAYHWGRDNGSNRSEKNFNDFLKTEAVQQALSITNVVEPKGKFYCGDKEGGDCNNYNFGQCEECKEIEDKQ